MPRNFLTITVRDLLDLLEGESPDARVIFAADYGDYHRTEQALPLRGEVDVVTIKESGYSDSGYAIAREELDADGIGDNYKEFLVIR